MIFVVEEIVFRGMSRSARLPVEHLDGVADGLDLLGAELAPLVPLLRAPGRGGTPRTQNKQRLKKGRNPREPYVFQ